MSLLTLAWLVSVTVIEGVADTGISSPVTLADVQPIFTEHCTECHNADNITAFSLEEGQAWSEIVDVSATQIPLFDRVEPGAPELSYLVHKLQGTQLELGGMGNQMPSHKRLEPTNALTDQELELIVRWVEDGALP